MLIQWNFQPQIFMNRILGQQFGIYPVSKYCTFLFAHVIVSNFCHAISLFHNIQQLYGLEILIFGPKLSGPKLDVALYYAIDYIKLSFTVHQILLLLSCSITRNTIRVQSQSTRKYFEKPHKLPI